MRHVIHTNHKIQKGIAFERECVFFFFTIKDNVFKSDWDIFGSLNFESNDTSTIIAIKQNRVLHE